jgi:hypothetical protein
MRFWYPETFANKCQQSVMTIDCAVMNPVSVQGAAAS